MYPPQARAQDEYLLQRINSASPEQLVALMLEGAQRFIAQAVQAIGRRDVPARARAINRASAIVEELMVRLNHEDGGETVQNLVRIYEWWSFEMFEASATSRVDRLERLSAQMGQMRETWEQAHSGRSGRATSGYRPEGMVG